VSVSITVIVPVYRDAAALARTLAGTDLSGADLVVASTADDDLRDVLRLAHPDIDIVCVTAPRGRARQMNAGAAVARGRWLVFLHADTRLPPGWIGEIAAADRDARVNAGCFRFALDSQSLFARVIELGVRARVALLGLAYGDQALFVRREAFEVLQGYADLPIMEDVDLVRRLRLHGRLFRSALPAVTSARRWERDGWVTRTCRHIALILLYFCGVPPARLIRLDPGRRPHPVTPPRRMSL
jgi:rSAM/selenodomain-associated transferase 2